MTNPVYVMDGIEEAIPGESIVMDGPEGHHAATVRRSRVGELFDVVNGRGYRVTCEVTAVHKRAVTLRVVRACREDEPLLRVTLVQALAKGGRDEQAVETATEYGAWSFIPWASERTVATWKGKEEKGRTKWENTVLSAAKQSRRSWIPSVEPLISTLGLCAQIQEEHPLVFVCHESANRTLASLLFDNNTSLGDGISCADNSFYDRMKLKNHQDIWVIVGPEGGITQGEIEKLEEAGAHTVKLGEHVLRSSSAGAYAIATLHTWACVMGAEPLR